MTTTPADPVEYNDEYKANTAIGSAAFATGAGYLNTAFGANALEHVEYEDATLNEDGQVETQEDEAKGVNNTAVGAYALTTATTGSENTAVGTNALFDTTNGSDNTAVGAAALFDTTTGSQNTAIGANSYEHLRWGKRNTGIGCKSGYEINGGSDNVAVGLYSARGCKSANGGSTEGNIFIGKNSAGGGSQINLYDNSDESLKQKFTNIQHSIFIGKHVAHDFEVGEISPNLDNIICIGYKAIPHLDNDGNLTESNQMVLGDVNLSNIYTDANMTISGNLTVAGTINGDTGELSSDFVDLTASNSLAVGSTGQMTVDAAGAISGASLTTTGDVIVGSTLTASGAISGASTNITGGAEIGGNATIQGSLAIDGTVTANNQFDAGGNASVQGQLTVNNGMYVTGNQVQVDGYGVTAQSFTTTSDTRLKSGIVPVSNALETVQELKPVQFTWIHSDERDIGFIAQDLLSVQDMIPGIVDTSNPDKLAVAYNRLIPMLVQSIQELSVRVKTLESASGFSDI